MTYIYEPGDVIRSSEHNKNINDLYKVQGEKAINDVSATNSGVLAGSSQKLIDKFLDSNGQNNTVNGATTAIYNSGTVSYGCNFSETGSELTQTAETTQSPDGSISSSRGYDISVNLNCFLYSVTKHVSCSATTARLRTSASSDIATATFSGNVATFATPQKLIAGVNYEIVADSGGATYTMTSKYTSSYPYSNDYIDFVAFNEGGNDYAQNIISTNVKASNNIDSTIQSSATTIPTGMTKVFVTPLMYEALATGDSITADVSIDNGAHYTTGVPINTWTPITSANGTQLIVKANLNTADGSTTPKVSGWRVLME